MKNKKGFTLVELLAVIVLLAIVGAIGSLGVTKVKKSIEDKLTVTKLEQALNAATEYAEDYKQENCTIQITDLITKEYLESEEGTTYKVDKDGTETEKIDNNLINMYANAHTKKNMSQYIICVYKNKNNNRYHSCLYNTDDDSKDTISLTTYLGYIGTDAITDYINNMQPLLEKYSCSTNISTYCKEICS